MKFLILLINAFCLVQASPVPYSDDSVQAINRSIIRTYVGDDLITIICDNAQVFINDDRIKCSCGQYACIVEKADGLLFVYCQDCLDSFDSDEEAE